MSLQTLREEIGVVNDLLCVAALLIWFPDHDTLRRAVEARGLQIATLMNAAP